VKHAVRTHLKDFVAITGLILVALVVLLIVLSNQKAALPSWVPGLGQEFYSINAEFETAQAVTPGQGQAAVIAGINVGKVGASSLADGVAKVRLDIEPRYRELIHSDAEFLLRPKTGLSDMVVEIDPGTEGPPPEDGATLPVSQGLSNVQMDQIWASLDGDTQDYLVLLLDGVGEGVGGKGPELSQALRRFGPFAQYTAKLNGALEKRRENIKGSIHSFSKVATELGNNDEAVADFISNSRRSLQGYADEESSLRAALREFPSTLAAAQEGLTKSNRLSLEMRPTLLGLIPGAKNLKSSLQSVQSLARNSTATVRDDIRPFTRNVQPVFSDLARTSRASSVTTRQQRGFFTEINTLLNYLAYNPPGDRQEGFLFWAPWLSHNLNSSINAQDAAGPVRRGISTVSCNTAQRAKDVGGSTKNLMSIYQLNQLPPPTAPADGGICINPLPAKEIAEGTLESEALDEQGAASGATGTTSGTGATGSTDSETAGGSGATGTTADQEVDAP
jgi:phospholipid/cholesterol/gamma-HCH transport system substrate-binding protein